MDIHINSSSYKKASVSTYVEDALEKIKGDKIEMALSSISIALDATAQKTYPSLSGSKAYKKLLSDNLRLMMQFTCGMDIRGIRTCYPDIKPESDGLVPWENILYHVVRCSLIHTAELQAQITFTKERALVFAGDEKLILPICVLKAMIFIVVTSPVNKGGTISKNWHFGYGGAKIPFNDFWANRALVESLVGDRFNRLKYLEPS